MEALSELIRKAIPIWITIFGLAVLFGTLYAADLAGIGLGGFGLLLPDRLRSLHISLMLYGPPALMLSMLPFFLFARDGIAMEGSVTLLRYYLFFWHLFLAVMSITILFGLKRDLPFYDFIYELNFLLAFAGLFYIIALFRTVRLYNVKPLWIKVSLTVTLIAPLALLVLMNPTYGQVEDTITGPHGDNTLGMSFAFIPIYYLAIKLHTPGSFKGRWNIMWIIPLAGYTISILVRILWRPLSYNEEWVSQYLTFLYLPLLLRWLRDARLTFRTSPLLVISIWSFLVVMIEGNIFFIPQIRELIHRNDLVIAHAHLAVGGGVLFLALAIISPIWNRLQWNWIYGWSALIGILVMGLSYSGLIQSGILHGNILYIWSIRVGIGLLVLGGILYWSWKSLKHLLFPISMSRLYHTGGFFSDGVGGMVLILTAPGLFPLLGLAFSDYLYPVFGFMTLVGSMHLISVVRSKFEPLLGRLTMFARLLTGTIFLTLFMADKIDHLGLLVGSYDLLYGLSYLIVDYLTDRRNHV